MGHKIKIKASFFFLLPSLLGVLVFVLIPFLDVVRRSFTTAVTGKFVGIQNYKTIFTNQAFLLAAGNTLKFTLICIPMLVVIGLGIALVLSAIPKMQFIRIFYLIPMAIPTATVVLVWKMVFYEQGFLNSFLTSVGEITGWYSPVRIDYLNQDSSFYVLAVSYIWKNIGYTVLLWLTGIMGIPLEIKEAAKMDGAGAIQSFFYVTAPNLKGALYTIVILSFLNSFKVYREAYLVAGSYPQEKIYLLQHLFNNWFVNLELDKMAAAAVCTGALLFFFILLLQRLWDRN